MSARVRVGPETPLVGWGELWTSRELLFFLAWRDLKVRYKQTVLGVAWAMLQPLLTMCVFAVFFGRLAGVPSDGIPYPLFSFAALLPWMLFANALSGGAQSLVANQHLLTKVYFPRLHLPLASVFVPLVDMVIGLLILIPLMAVYGRAPGPGVALLPAFVLLAILASLAASLGLAVLNAMYRDFRYVVPFLVQLWLFVTPVAYPASLVPPAWRAVYGLNPMATVVEGFRWALLDGPAPELAMVCSSFATVLVGLSASLVLFRWLEDSIADVV